MRRRSIPAWAQRRNRERDVARGDREQARIDNLLGDLLVDGLWSNSALRAYCLACRPVVPPPVLEFMFEPETACAACGQRVAVAVRELVGAEVTGDA